MLSNLKNFVLKNYHKFQVLGSQSFGPAILATIFPQRIRQYPVIIQHLKGKNGLEIGGPSRILRRGGQIPVYPIVDTLDGCNFSYKTVWEGSIQPGQSYQYQKGKKNGRQFIADATDLRGIPSQTYDFVLSSHALEHIANPFKAVMEWLRVLRDDGSLLLVLPHKDGTFDHRRPVTTLQHLISDLNSNMNEDDLTHLSEILKWHDLRLDPAAGDIASFKLRSLKNFENRCLHHHVFDTCLAVRIFDYFNLQILCAEVALPCHIVVLGRKVKDRQTIDNIPFLGTAAEWRRQSPFRTDQEGVVK